MLLVDTAGRLAIDEPLMLELEAIKAAVQPDNILLVVDSMIGQDSVRTANEFNRRIGIDGFVLNGVRLDRGLGRGSRLLILAANAVTVTLRLIQPHSLLRRQGRHIEAS